MPNQELKVRYKCMQVSLSLALRLKDSDLVPWITMGDATPDEIRTRLREMKKEGLTLIPCPHSDKTGVCQGTTDTDDEDEPENTNNGGEPDPPKVNEDDDPRRS